VLFAFAETVIKYSIPYDLIDAFLSSMKSDLKKAFILPERRSKNIFMVLPML
jgi:hypothetical protein